MSEAIDPSTKFDDAGDLISLALHACEGPDEPLDPALPDDAEQNDLRPAEGETEQENEHENDRESQQAAEQTDPQPLTGYELVADMMRRQDEVLDQLDALNARIESAINKISASRKSEIDALESELAIADQQASKAA